MYSAFILIFFVLGTLISEKRGPWTQLHPISQMLHFTVWFLLLMVTNVWLKRGKQREALRASCAILAQPQSQSKCKWLQVMREDSGCPFSIDTLRLCCSIPAISASSLPSLVSLWQPLGILGNRLVYSTFHHTGYWIIHPTISRGQREGEEVRERERVRDRRRKGGRSEWTGFIPPARVNWL